jgi:2-amino-4-hydroxy-6-hydroxymethyldihydropteridine diphosphokinase
MQQIDSGSGPTLQPEPEDQRHQASPVPGAAAVAVALGANLGDPLPTLLAVRPLLAAELLGWWRELGRPQGLGEGRDRGAGDGGAADRDRNGEGAGGWARDGAWNRDGAKGSAAARLRWSPLFRTAPVGGPAGQPDYLNAVVVIDGGPPPAAAERPGLAGTPPGSGQSAAAQAIAPAGATVEPDAGAALALLRRLQRLEQRFGRVRAEPWGPRSLDLDLLWCGPLHLERPELQLPHPRLRERAFVLTPLAAIDPELVVPGAGIWPPPAGQGARVEAAAAEHPAATAGMLLAALPAAALEPPPQRRHGRRGWPE